MNLNKNFINSTAFEHLVGKNSNYYRSSFLKIVDFCAERERVLSRITLWNRFVSKEFRTINMAVQNSSSFNWMACIFSEYWFAYRKMYFIAYVVLILTITLEYFINAYYPDNIRYIIALYLVISISSGRLANETYFHSLMKKLRIQKSNLEIAANGGTSITALIFLVISAFFLGYLPELYKLYV